MAESYKGLTIRIGGDATGLQKALRTATQASAGAGQELRKLKDAVKLDPGNVEAYTMQMGYMAEQAAATSMKLYQLRDAAQQVSQEEFTLGDGSVQTVGQLVASTKNAHTAAAQAKAAYNKVTDSIAEMYTTLSKYNEEETKIGGDFLESMSKGLNIESSVDQLKEFGKWANDVYKDLSGVMQEPKRSVDEIIDEMTKLQDKFNKTKSDMLKEDLSKQFEKLRKELVEISGLKISFAEGNTDFDSLYATLDKLEGLGFDTGQITAFKDEVDRLKVSYVNSMNQLKAMNEAARFSDLTAEIIKTEASIKNMAKAIASMKEPSDLMRGMTDLTEQVKSLDDAYKALKAQGNALTAAFSINPENTEAQNAAMAAFAESERVAAERAAVLREQIAQFDESKIDAYADSTKSAREQLIEASVAHAAASEKVADFTGKIEAAQYNLVQLGLDAKEVSKILKGDLTIENPEVAAAVDHDVQNIQDRIEWLKKLRDALVEQKAAEEALSTDVEGADRDAQIDGLNIVIEAYGHLREAEEAERKAAEADMYAHQREELQGLKSDLAAAEGQVDDARVSMQKLANADIKPHIDTTEIERLKDVKKDLEDYGSSVGQAFSGAANDIKVVTALTSDLESRAKSLMEAFQADPTNVNALELSVRATDEAMNGCKIRAAQLKEIIEQYTPDKIDEAAIATNTVGINAERAAFAVSEAFKAIDEAKKEADDLGKKLSEAMKSAAGSNGGKDNPTVTALREQFEAARQKVEELEAAAQKALAAMDTANATAEVSKYREELAKAEQQMIKLAQTQATAFKEGAIADTFGTETKELIDGLGTSLNTAVERAKAFDAALKVDPYNVELLAGKTQAYADVAVLAKQRTEAIKEAIANYDTSKLDALKSKYQTIEEAVRKTTKEYVNTEAAVKKAEGALESMLKDAGMEGMLQDVLANADAFENQLTPDIMKAVNALKDLIAKAQEAKGAMTDAAEADFYEKSVKGLADTAKTADLSDSIDSAAVMTALDKVASAAQRAGQAIVDSANTVDAAYRDMRKTVNGTEEEFESIKAAAIEFSQTHAVTADTLLEMEALGGQLGITTQMLDSGKTALQEFGEVAANLDIATDISANDIALKLGQITNVMSDLDFSTFENFADALVRLGNNVPATESAIMDVAQRIAAVANVTSMSTPQVLGWSAAIASTGTNAESAATSITKTITGIGQAVAEGGNKLQAFADIAGMTADEFKKKWETSSSDALEAFIVGLSKLTDPSTAAIEALDSVGISSVRQETALLALSQTVDNLGESVTMASDAFNGISDEWGNAGDAANEAQNKSEGFSGALAIMKNNAAALAQTLGDSLVEPIKLVSNLLKLLTDALNALPAPVKTIITVFGGATVAISTISPILQVAGKAIGGLINTLSKSNNVAQFAAQITGLKAATDAATASSTGLTTALSGLNLLKFAGIALAVTAIVALISAIAGVIEQYKKMHEAETRLEESSKRLANAAKGAASAEKELKSEISGIHTTAEDATEFINNLAAAQERLAESFENQNYDLQVNTATAEEAFAHIQELMDKVSSGVKLNPFDQAELESSVAILNETMGMGLEIVDASTASIKGMGDESELTATKLKKMVDAEIESATRTLLVQQYVEAQQSLLEAESKLSEVKDNATANENAYAKALEATGSVYSNSLVPSTRDAIDANLSYARTTSDALASQTNLDLEVQKAQESVDSYQQTVDELHDRLYNMGAAEDAAANDTSDLAAALETLLKNSDDVKACLKEMGEDISKYDFAKLAQDFANAGVSEEDFANLTAAQLARIMTAYNGTSTSVVNAIGEMGIALKGLSGDTEDAAEATEENTERMEKATAEALEAFKRQNEAYYTEQKRIRDDYYDNEKRDLERKYDEQKDILDDAYTEQKRIRDDAYDQEKRDREDVYDDFKDQLDDYYEYEKRKRDAEYEDAKRQLDDYYEYQKRIRDDNYDDLKDALDDAYEYEKRLRDDAYDDYKETLDDAYDAAKDAMDDWLDDYKDALDKEVEAFEKATDERLKLMEKEYDEKRKLIDDQEEADTSDIDERIKAIDDMIAAEEKAQKLADREAKINEYTAKRDKYAQGSAEWEKANKELENLMTKYHNEDVKEERDEYKAYLKEVKEQIKKDADERRDQLKNSYDQEKEAYKDSRDEMKEAMKEANEDEYNEQKKLKEAELKLIKDANEGQLQIYKRNNEDELTQIKRGHEDILTERKRQHEDELTQIKRDNEDILTELKNTQADELTDVKRTNSEKLENLKETQDLELTDIKRHQEDELTWIKRGQENILEQLKTDHDQQLLELKRHHEDELTEIKNHIDDENEAYKNGGQPAVDALNNVNQVAETTSTNVANAVTTASKTLNTELGTMTTESRTKVGEALSAIKEGLNSGDPEVVASTKKVVSDMSDELYGIVLAAQSDGMEVPVEISKAILENANLSAESVGTLVDTITGSFGPISPAAKREMETAMLAISSTLTSKTPETVAAANQFVNENATALMQLVNEAQSVGIQVPPTLSQALYQNSDTLQVATANLADGAINILGSALPPGMTGVIKTAVAGMAVEMQNADSAVRGAEILAKQVSVPLDQLSPYAKAKVQQMITTLSTELQSDDPQRVKAAEKLVSDISTPLATIVDVAQKTGTDVPLELIKAMVISANQNKDKPKTVTDAIEKYFKVLSETMGIYGKNASVGWNNEFVKKTNETIIPNVKKVAEYIASAFAGVHKIQSPSKLFAWYAEMDAMGFINGWDKSSDKMAEMVGRTASDMTDAFDIDWSDSDATTALLERMKANQERVVTQTKAMMDDIVETMRQREDMLREQAERMARIVEEGFDPTLTAAYEAIDTIDAGKMRRQQYAADLQSKRQTITNAPVINITIPEMVVREEADINRVSEQIARRLRRELASALG